MTDIPKQYEPAHAQQKWLTFWEEHGYFNAEPHAKNAQGAEKKPHTIMIPLPNVTGALHMGHALNGTIQDLITRWRRMQGYEALWMPGTDHAGIATQAVVERRMFEEEGLTRHDIGREALVNRIWRWKDTYEQRILNQLKQLGASCDWRRTRFTLDEVCTKAVRRTFFKLFKEGKIYRGKRLVNWDTHLQTAVADDEVYSEDVDGNFWTFNYPVINDDGAPTGQKISFSTTRPETMCGDTAVCVHPTDERYTDLVGKQVRIPINGRDIPIIADALLANKELGTGAVKVTPAHDPNDYACGQRNDLPMINVLNPDGTMNAEAKQFAGMDRYECRRKIVEEMEQLGHFEQVEQRPIPLKHSDRSKTPVEPYLSDQWFVKMDELAQSAIDAVEDNRVRFFPSRYAKTYLDWLGEKRDWCISRQLWWGHRIPVWNAEFPTAKDAEDAKTKIEAEGWFDPNSVALFTETDETTTRLLICIDGEHNEIEEALEAGTFGEFEQDPDVLDTWFSSALWPHATLGWPDTDHNPPLAGQDPLTLNPQPSTNEVLDYFYPGNVLVTSRDIITLWVARMVLTGLYNMGDIPFGHVCIHPKILDGFGQGMSKSKGNGVDPMDLIDKYGTDAVRFTIASFAGETQDVRIPVSYECPHCGEVIPQALDDGGPMVKPATIKAKLRGSSEKLLMPCAKCGKDSQFSTPQYEFDPEQPVARMVSERFEYGRNFCNKFWNATRFAMLNLEGYTPAPLTEEDLCLEDRWIRSRLATVSSEITTYLDRYQFDFATRTLRDFIWNEFCDWYLEMIKPRLRDDDLKPAAQRMLVGVLDMLLRLLSPFTPFIVEELWQRLGEFAPARGLTEIKPAEPAAIIAAWPELPSQWKNEGVESRFARLQETIIAVRNVRAVYKIAPSTPLKLYIRSSEDIAGEMNDVSSQFDNLAKTVLEAAGAEIDRPPQAASFALGDADGYIPLTGIIDVAEELKRQKGEADKLKKFIKGHQAKLSNEKFTSKAPSHVVEQHRETLAGWEKQLESVQEIIGQLGG